MFMKKIKFITAFYSDLYGTEFGGRIGRSGHYKWSLLSLLKMTDADFLCYTSEREIEELKDFFYSENSISPELLKLKVFDISQTKFKDLINTYKNIEETKKSDRCIEIQYSKFIWWWDEDQTYEYYYWIDAGLSHCGLIPNKYLTLEGPHNRGYYESSLFNNNFLKNLTEFTDDKIFLIGKDNVRNYWSGTVDPKWYKEYNQSIHIIGGLFGGKKEKWNQLVQNFEYYTQNIIETDKKIYMEENIMSLMFFNHQDLFSIKLFDTWWHPEAPTLGLSENYFDVNRSFYRILEELNNIT
jgi:hypothetical protein